MRESEKAEAYTEAINLLVDQAVTAAKPKSPGAYAATVRADLNKRLRPVARAMFDTHDDVTADELATLLGAHETAAKRPDPPAPAAPPLPTYRAEPWRPVPPEVRRQAKERLAAIRNTLKENAS